MTEPTTDRDDFSATHEREYQDHHYPDDEPEVVSDEPGPRRPAPSGKPSRLPPPCRRYDED